MKLATTPDEARQMLSFINTINKINMIQKHSNSSNVHSSVINSNIETKLEVIKSDFSGFIWYANIIRILAWQLVIQVSILLLISQII